LKHEDGKFNRMMRNGNAGQNGIKIKRVFSFERREIKWRYELRFGDDIGYLCLRLLHIS